MKIDLELMYIALYSICKKIKNDEDMMKMHEYMVKSD